MGLKDKLKNKKNSVDSIAIDLCDVSINSIFNKCIASPTTLPSDIEKTFLFANFTDPNFVDTTKPITFDKQKIKENYKKIQFMFGQLDIVHKNELKLTPETSLKKYDGSDWTEKDVSLMQLYYLAIASELMLYFSPKTNFAPIIVATAVPTKSPNDPNFQTWWEEHKSEWEDQTQEQPQTRRPGGTEPFDN